MLWARPSRRLAFWPDEKSSEQLLSIKFDIFAIKWDYHSGILGMRRDLLRVKSIQFSLTGIQIWINFLNSDRTFVGIVPL